MQVLLYHELDALQINGFDKWRQFIEANDFKSADIKKIGDNLYRARLNRTDRLLFAFYKYQRKTFVLVLEYLKNHNYAASRFLNNNITIETNKIPNVLKLPDAVPLLPILPTTQKHFYFLDKVICLDNDQQNLYYLNLPLIIIGAAGSGKTVVTLEKLKTLQGRVLYTTLSPYLAKHAQSLYYAKNYQNKQQKVEFLSFSEVLESIQVPEGKPITFDIFNQWLQRFPNLKIKDAFTLFAEFRNVITGLDIDKPYLNFATYQLLGIRQSIFSPDERTEVYNLFLKYLKFLKDETYYDLNLLSFDYLAHIEADYDAIIIDEVQDLNNLQIYLLLSLLKQKNQFVLCGDANQIVQPSYFAWKNVRNLLQREMAYLSSSELVNILRINYRNPQVIAELANKILKIKYHQFGVLDRESHYLLESQLDDQGQISLMSMSEDYLSNLNAVSCQSVDYAIIVLDEKQKQLAKQYFTTPLIFSIQEAKGLEYKNIILFNVINTSKLNFTNLLKDLTPQDLKVAEIRYNRAKNKHNKQAEFYKFYLNTLYVAITRATQSIYWLETDLEHCFLKLLELTPLQQTVELTAERSSTEAWQQEIQRLKSQGKLEQVQQIEQRILPAKAQHWTVLDSSAIENALHNLTKADKLTLAEYALVYRDSYIFNRLIEIEFKTVFNLNQLRKQLLQKEFLIYLLKTKQQLAHYIVSYGIDVRNRFNLTPLLSAFCLEDFALVNELLAQSANIEVIDNQGFLPLHYWLRQLTLSDMHKDAQFFTLYHQLLPVDLDIQVDGRLVKLSYRSDEGLLFNLMYAGFYEMLPRYLLRGDYYTLEYLSTALSKLPPYILVIHQIDAKNLAEILKKHEIFSVSKESKKLFYCLAENQYIINPTLMIKINDQWKNIHEILRLDRLSYFEPYKAGKNASNIYEYKRYLQIQNQQLQTQLSTLNNLIFNLRSLLLNQLLEAFQMLCANQLQQIQDD
jgi:hypothetical protein